MKYGIISINDDRKSYKDAIRSQLRFEEVSLNAVNGSDINILDELEKRGLELTEWVPRKGELGVWLSMFDAWETASQMDEPLIVFEDDAVIDESFHPNLEIFMRQLPGDFSFMALWVPENQKQDFFYDVRHSDDGTRTVYGTHTSVRESHYYLGHRYVCKAYQGYGMVSIMYSPQGGKALMEAARERGIYTPVDCFIFQEANHSNGHVKGYAPIPMYTGLVTYDWSAPTTIQNTEDFNAV